MQNLLNTKRATSDFFRWFEEAAANNVAAARLLNELCRGFCQPEALVEQIHELEHHGDAISHQIYEQLNQVFMPPLDREDILVLTSILDDVVDGIDAAADAMWVYNVQQPR